MGKETSRVELTCRRNSNSAAAGPVRLWSIASGRRAAPAARRGAAGRSALGCNSAAAGPEWLWSSASGHRAAPAARRSVARHGGEQAVQRPYRMDMPPFLAGTEVVSIDLLVGFFLFFFFSKAALNTTFI